MPDASPEVPAPPRGFRIPANFRALRHRNFRLFVTGQLVSLIGTWMQSVAQQWLVYRLTGDSAMLGLISFTGQIPSVFFAPVGGSLADTANRHKIIVATQATAMLLAFTLAGLTFTGMVQLWHLFVLAALLGMVTAFEVPARQAFMMEMVGREDLINAIALNSSLFNGSRIIGPAVAGLTIASVGEGWCFLINGVSFLAVLAGLLAMRVEPRRQGPRAGRSRLGHMADGFRYAATTPPVRDLLALLGFASLMGLSFTVLMPIFADKILHGGPSAYGLLMGASGLGALGGAFLLTIRKGVMGLGPWVFRGAAGFGLSLVAFSASTNFWLSVALLMPIGFSMMVQMGASNTLIQSMVPDELRGRVMSIYAMMLMGMTPLGSLMAGFLAKPLGAPGTVALGGAACVLGAVVFRLRIATIHEEGHRLIAAQASTPPG